MTKRYNEYGEELGQLPEGARYDLVIVTTMCSTPYGHVKDGEYRKRLLNRMRWSLSRSHVAFFKYIHLIREDANWNANYLELLAEAKTLAPLCLIVDSDGYFARNWSFWLHDALERYPGASGWQLFNSPRLANYDMRTLSVTPYHSIERRHASPHGLCFRTEDYVIPPKGEWFETFIGALWNKHGFGLGMGFVVPKVSMIQHCGMYGLNNLPGASEDYDPNFPLNNECIDLQENQSQNPIEGENLCKTT